MIYYGGNDYRDYLAHHGILGQKWGKRNGPPYPLGYGAHSKIERKAGWEKSLDREKRRKELSALYKSKSVNLNKWGTDKDHNVLYITGLSGSGKSTLARKMAKDFDCDTIHLDYYFNQMSDESRKEFQSKSFNKYLDKTVPNWRNIPQDSPQKVDWKTVDKFALAIESYGAEQYKNGRKVIAEGVELMDSTLYENRSAYKDKPYMMVNTSALTSHVRGNKRDGMSGLDFFYRVPMYLKTSKIKSDAVNELSLKGMKAIDIDRLLDDFDRTKYK